MILKEFFMKWRRYSFKYAIYSSAWWIGWYVNPLRKICFWGQKKKTEYLDNYMVSKYSKIINKYEKIHSSENKLVDKNDFPIWVFWAQDFENAPELVKACYENLINHNGKAVRAITLENIYEYVSIPNYIIEKVEKGTISLTHYSDIIRICLLAEYGGIWLDATCWVSGPLPNWVKNYSFYSSNSVGVAPLPLWSDSRWAGWGQGTNEVGSIFYVFLKEMFFAYWKNENYLIDYLLIDYLMFLGYRKNLYVRKSIDFLPNNNLKRNSLHFLLNEEFNQRKYIEIASDSWLFKLSYKTPWHKKTSNNKKTFYGYITEG